MNLHLFHSLWDRKPFQMNILIDFIWNFIRRVLIRNALYKSFWSKMKTLNATSEMIRLYSAKLVLRWGKRTEVLKKPLKMKEERKFFSFLKPDTGWVGWPKLKLRDWAIEARIRRRDGIFSHEWRSHEWGKIKFPMSHESPVACREWQMGNFTHPFFLF